MSTHIAGRRRAAILEAAVALLAEVGYDRMSLDTLAARVGASKATLYRHWSDKRSLVIDAFDQALTSSGAPDDGGSLRTNLLTAFCGPGGLAHPTVLAAFRGLISALNEDDLLASAVRDRVLSAHDARVAGLIDGALERGEIEPVDVDVFRAAVVGFAVYRASIDGRVVTTDAIAAVIDRFLPDGGTPT